MRTTSQVWRLYSNLCYTPGGPDGTDGRTDIQRGSAASEFSVQFCPSDLPSLTQLACPRGLQRGCLHHETPETGQQRCNPGKIMCFGIECNERRRHDPINTPTYSQRSHSIAYPFVPLSKRPSLPREPRRPLLPIRLRPLPYQRTCAEKEKGKHLRGRKARSKILHPSTML